MTATGNSSKRETCYRGRYLPFLPFHVFSQSFLIVISDAFRPRDNNLSDRHTCHPSGDPCGDEASLNQQHIGAKNPRLRRLTANTPHGNLFLNFSRDLVVNSLDQRINICTPEASEAGHPIPPHRTRIIATGSESHSWKYVPDN